jgi:hypothetical protein
MLEGTMRMGGNRVRITAKLIESEAVFGSTASTAHWRTYSICSRQTSSVAPRISSGQPTPLAQESKMTEMRLMDRTVRVVALPHWDLAARFGLAASPICAEFTGAGTPLNPSIAQAGANPSPDAGNVDLTPQRPMP